MKKDLDFNVSLALFSLLSLRTALRTKTRLLPSSFSIVFMAAFQQSIFTVPSAPVEKA